MVDLVNLNSVIISNDPTQMVNFPTWVTDWDFHKPALFDFFWRQYLFYNGFPSIGKFWSHGCLNFHWLSIKRETECHVSLRSLWLFSCWLGRSPWSFERCSIRGYLFLKLVLLLLLINFVRGFRLKLMNISLNICIRSSLTHLHNFQLLVLLP